MNRVYTIEMTRRSDGKAVRRCFATEGERTTFFWLLTRDLPDQFDYGMWDSDVVVDGRKVAQEVMEYLS